MGQLYRYYFYPRSPCGERPPSDGGKCKTSDFYPRSPCGERLFTLLGTPDTWTISIHALLAESDSKMLSRQSHSRNFYPRSPCGERHVSLAVTDFGKRFLSTLSLRRATHIHSTLPGHPDISIHALLAESDMYPSQ